MHPHHTTRQVIWAISLLVLLTGMSCSLVAGGLKQPAEVNSDSFTPQPLPTQEGTLEIDSSLQSLKSYSGHLTISFKGDNNTSGTADASADILIEEDRVADAYHEDSQMILNPANPPVGDKMYWIADKEYTVTWSDFARSQKTGCMVQSYHKDPQVVHSGFSSYIHEIKKGALVGKGELVNGVKTDHYQVVGASFTTADHSKVSGDVWVAQEGGYIVKAAGQVEADLTDERKLHGHGVWNFELAKVNATTIDLDPACKATSHTDFPLPPDAQNFTASQGFMGFSTQMPAKQVAEFYQQALPPLGFAIEEQKGQGDDTRYMWSVTRGSDLYMLDIMQSNGMTLVNIAKIK